MSIAPKAEHDRNQEATVYLGNLDDRCSDALIWELMLQAGPVSNVFLPKDRISGTHQGFGFCEFLAEQDADYAAKIMNQIKLYGKPIRVSRASYDTKKVDIGANLFIGNLDENVDESQLYDTFQTFGSVSEQPKIARDPTTGQSKGYGFISYHEFEAADMAIENMNGQFFGGKQINVQYAFKKDGKGERHGTQAERLMAAQAKKQSMMPSAGTMAAVGYQGRFAGALSSAPPVPAAPSVPPPPPGMPVYRPPMTPGPPSGAPTGPSGGAPGGYGMPPPPAYPPPMGFQNGYGAPPQAPPPGFGANGYQQQPPMPVQGMPGMGMQGYPQGYPPGPPPQGFPPQGPGMQMGGGGYQGYQGQPPPPPPLRMGFNGQQ